MSDKPFFTIFRKKAPLRLYVVNMDMDEKSIKDLLNEAKHHEGKENLSEALKLYLDVLEIEPNHHKTLNKLGEIYFKLGRLNEAEKVISKVLKINPRDLNAFSNYTRVCLLQKKTKKALEVAQKALAENPNSHEVFNNLGVIYLELNLPEKAKASFQSAIRLNPKDPSAYQNLGFLLMNLNDFHAAFQCYQQLVELKPQNPDALKRYATSAIYSHHWKEAIITYHQIFNTEPESPILLNNLAMAYKMTGQSEKEYDCFMKALSINPNDLLTLNNLGVFYYELGDMTAAESHYRKVLELNPIDPMALKGLTSCKIFTNREETHELLNQIERSLKKIQHTKQDQSLLYYAKGKILNDLESWDEAFASYQKANSLLGSSFQRIHVTENFEVTKRVFTKELFEQKCQYGSTSHQPIFIIGMPRSGTTLTEQILSRHPDVVGCGEREDIYLYTKKIPELIGGSKNYPEAVEKITPIIVQKLAEDYLEIESGCSQKFRYIVDKMPNNFMHLGLISILFPQAKIIHCKRNPYDVGISLYFQDFIFDNLGWTTDLYSIGFCYRQYEELMNYWKRVLPIEIYEIEYENLVNSPEEECKKLYSFCGLEWNDSYLEFQQANKKVFTRSAWQVRQPLYKSSINRWKHFKKFMNRFKEGYEQN